MSLTGRLALTYRSKKCSAVAVYESSSSTGSSGRWVDPNRPRLAIDLPEIIIATNPSVDGEATALYLARVLTPLGIRVSRIASGMPIGGDFEYADPATISKAFSGRHQLSA